MLATMTGEMMAIQAQNKGAVPVLADVRDPFAQIFNPDVILHLQAKPMPPELRWRTSVMTACGPSPSDWRKARDLREYRAWRAAWDAYVTAALACGLFADPEGYDLRRRLCSEDPASFYAALAECMTCWFFAGKLRMDVRPRPGGKNNRTLDMLVDPQRRDWHVEVKAPYRPFDDTRIFNDDFTAVGACIKEAERQFAPGAANILVLVPHLGNPLYARHRDTLIQPMFGREVLYINLNNRTGEAVGPSYSAFVPDGKFLKTQHADGRQLKPDGTPRFTRISAVVCLEDRLEEHRLESGSTNSFIAHDIVILHNPNAAIPVLDDVWADIAQLIPDGDRMCWTDEYHGF